MTRKEFILELRKELSDELPLYEVENNISYYEGYFAKSTKSDEKIVEEIGEPRLIAKTIIESYRISKGINNISGRNIYEEERESGNNIYSGWKVHFGSDIKAPWYKKLLWMLIIVLVILGIIVVSSFVIRIFLIFALPIFVIFLIFKLLRSSK